MLQQYRHYTFGDAMFTDLDYADDAVLFTQDSGRWRFDEAATTMGLHTSWEKTKLQNIGHCPPPQSVSVYGHPVAVTDQFVYLGSTILTRLATPVQTSYDECLASSVMLDRVWRQKRLHA